MHHVNVRPVLASVAALVLSAGLGCSGMTHDQKQSETVSPDGMTATQSRSQIRETPGGATVKETEVRTREVIKAPTTMPDASKMDPAK